MSACTCLACIEASSPADDRQGGAFFSSQQTGLLLCTGVNTFFYFLSIETVYKCVFRLHGGLWACCALLFFLWDISRCPLSFLMSTLNHKKPFTAHRVKNRTCPKPQNLPRRRHHHQKLTEDGLFLFVKHGYQACIFTCRTSRMLNVCLRLSCLIWMHLQEPLLSVTALQMQPFPSTSFLGFFLKTWWCHVCVSHHGVCISLFFIEHKQYLLLKWEKNILLSAVFCFFFPLFSSFPHSIRQHYLYLGLKFNV